VGHLQLHAKSGLEPELLVTRQTALVYFFEDPSDWGLLEFLPTVSSRVMGVYEETAWGSFPASVCIPRERVSMRMESTAYGRLR
jgi:hypothetical protein